jgi:TonB family protein
VLLDDAQRLYPHAERTIRRFLAFTAASIALHALTLGAYRPGFGTAAPTGESTPALHAVLVPREPPAAPPDSESSLSPELNAAAAVEPGAATAEPQEQIQPVARAEPRTGAGGPDIPLPDKWYTAAEVDVRAEPRNNPNLEYPQTLAMSGVSGTVRLRIFIDERGIVRKVELADPGPEQAFDAIAQRAWDEVRFSPAIRNGVPVKSQKLLELDFTSALTPAR